MGTPAASQAGAARKRELLGAVKALSEANPMRMPRTAQETGTRLLYASSASEPQYTSAGTDAHATHEIDARVRGFVHGEEPAHGHGRARAVLESGVDVFSLVFFQARERY